MNNKQYYWFTVNEDNKTISPRNMDVKYSDSERALYVRRFHGLNISIVDGKYSEDESDNSWYICRSNVMPSWALNKLENTCLNILLQNG